MRCVADRNAAMPPTPMWAVRSFAFLVSAHTEEGRMVMEASPAVFLIKSLLFMLLMLFDDSLTGWKIRGCGEGAKNLFSFLAISFVKD